MLVILITKVYSLLPTSISHRLPWSMFSFDVAALTSLAVGCRVERDIAKTLRLSVLMAANK